MNEYKIELVARHRPEVLERILRVARHRGFTVTTMDMTLIESQVRLKITALLEDSQLFLLFHLFFHFHQLFFDALTFQRRKIIYEKDAVKMINFMLNTNSQ